MTMVIGVNCDSCGGFDIDAYSRDVNEDSFPRNGWMSINIHNERGNVVDSEIHVCSVPCLENLAKNLIKNEHEKNENHSHDHPHIH